MSGSDIEAAARSAAERAARTAYGRLVASLAARTRDIAAAEDALAEAFARALETWPKNGAPDRPEAWLLTVARRTAHDGARRAATRKAAETDLAILAEERAEAAVSTTNDDRLRLLFVCAHPAVESAIRTPLMLQTVLGVDAARIAAAFMVAPATMGQRLARAKAKIRDAGVAFEAPDPASTLDRLAPVLSAIYAAYSVGWDAAAKGADLADEALELARMAVAAAPRSAEAKGLLALILYSIARRPSRRDADGAYVPLSTQDTRLWSRDRIVEAERMLVAAATLGEPGRFQTEAAIQSLHVQRRLGGRVSGASLLALYDGLIAQTDAIGARIARAAAIAAEIGPREGLAALDALPERAVADHQPYWAARAALLSALGAPEATDARRRAAALTSDAAVAAHLSRGDG